jgi:hypothetical protein
VACDDGSSFDVSVDTDTLNMLSNAVTSINSEALGLSCSVNVQSPLTLGVTASAANQTSIYAVGGGRNDADTHFSFSAHVDPDTGAFKGSAVIQQANAAKQKGSVFCYSNFGQTRFAVVGINVQDSAGNTTPLIFQTRDTGTPSPGTPPQVWQLNTTQTDCTTFDFDHNYVVQGNVTVRP